MNNDEIKENLLDIRSHETKLLWRQKNFLILLLGDLLISFGSKVYELVLPLLIYELTKSSIVMGTMKAVEFLPNLLLAVFIGVLVDRTDRKRFLIYALFIQIILLSTLYISIKSGHKYILLFYIICFFFMALFYCYDNAMTSIVKDVIPYNLLTSANSKFSFISTFIGIIGPAISGFILVLSNLEDGLLITMLALLGGFIVFSFLKSHKKQVEAKKENQSIFEDIKEGWIELRRSHSLWLLTLIVVFTNATSGLFDSMVIFFAEDSFHLSSFQLGVVFSIAGLGGLIGSLSTDYISKKLKFGKLIGITIFSIGFSYIIMYFASNIFFIALSLFLEGIFNSIFAICVYTYRQETTPSHLIGRISGITGAIFMIGVPLSMFGSGWIASIINTKYYFLVQQY
ncbi:MFS transporter [Thermoanaerobacterium thermosaccharolyticum]|uniref:MFS transporter n=1 Tax=Thermoanaerobacterium thermosaccharolyticum TaxID=1517 RepID=UPI0015C5E7AD|nr:MFS transporter [Thermoanaerobacterium thermosaccharolyticum]